MGVLIEFDIGEAQSRLASRLGAHAGPAQDHPQPGNHLFQTEWLGHVVVCAQRQAGDLVLQAVPCREEQCRCVDAVGAQPAQNSESIHSGHHHVEDHRVGADRARQVQGGGSAVCGIDIKALEFKTDREQLDDVRFIVDHQHLGGGGAVGGEGSLVCLCRDAHHR
ncbi:Uncharacterised protein [Mycobacteroides abscessus subsp. abscessus]|nr:Uncharacterised protein [Mycobacteroides abscessus subsp. abscessus]